MTTTDILTDMVLVESKKTAPIHAPIDRVDSADWLLQAGRMDRLAPLARETRRTIQ